MFARLTAFWSSLSLARRFALAAAPVFLAGMAVLGLWVTNRIAEGVVRNTGSATALWLDGVIAPLNDELASGQAPSPIALRALAEVFARPDISGRIAEFRIWSPEGTLLFATDPDLTGQTFKLSPALQDAVAGNVTTEFGGRDETEGALPSPEGNNLLEIYAPIREAWSGRIIAAAEVYQQADDLASDLRYARNRTWAVVAATALLMIAALFGIVRTGSNTIKDQQSRLERRLAAMQVMADQNRDLRLSIQAASGRATALNERYLRRISADLHDGPAQNLAVAALRLHRVASISDTAERSAEVGEIRSVLDAAMQEIRGISRGLVLPEIEGMPLLTLLERVCATHESRSRTSVVLSAPDIAGIALDHPRNICIYRFVQEGLNNAFKHGHGIDQRVSASRQSDRLMISVSNHGGSGHALTDSDGLGLAGLRERVESLGGTFTFVSNSDSTLITMTLGLEDQ